MTDLVVYWHMQAQASRRAGFTIVELLVVIVVIGILAALTIVSYSGIAKQAVVASLKSDLTNASRQLKVFHVDNGSYPTSINTCPATTGTMCLKPSQGNTFDEYTRPTTQTFTLRAKNGSSIFLITDNTAPSEVAPLTAIAAISGTAQVGSTLTAGALTPSGATASYQWQRADASDGPYSNISGAPSNTYTPVSADGNKYLRVVATGIGSYWDSVTSAPTAKLPVPPVAVVINGSFTNTWWGADYVYDDESEYCVYDQSLTTKATFNLSSYTSSAGSFTAATVSWSRSVYGSGVGGRSKFLKRDDTQVVLQSWDITVDVTNLSNSALLTFVNSKRGTTATLFWDSDYGECHQNIWGSQSGLSAPTLTLTWQPT
jgi:prepilin-type N-terminal cleavage/methylation domain-containing protein